MTAEIEPLRRSPVAETAITEAPTVPTDVVQLVGNALHAYSDGIPPDQDRCDCPTAAIHDSAVANNMAAAYAVLEFAWPAITAHFTKLGLLAHGEGMRALVDAKTELERRVEDLRDFEREYRHRLRAVLSQDAAALQTMLYRLDGELPSADDVRDYMRQTGWTEGRDGRVGTLWTRTRPGYTEPDKIGLVFGMTAGGEHWQGVVERLAKANGLSYSEQITAIKDSKVSPR
jgi:hypothetical protein